MIVKSSHEDIVIPEKPFGTFLLQAITKHAHKVALIDPEKNTTFTFKQIGDQAIAFANLLHSCGVDKGSIVTLVLPYQADVISLILGVALCGSVCQFCSPTASYEDLINQIIVFKSSYFITALELPGSLKGDAKMLKGVWSFEHLKSSSQQHIGESLTFNVSIDVHDPLFIFYSSGTTGKPKGIVHTNYSLISHALTVVAPAVLSGCAVAMTTIPRIHQAVMLFVSAFLYQGIKHLICPKITLGQFNELVELHKVNAVLNTNTLLLMDIVGQGKMIGLESLQYISTSGVVIPAHIYQKGTKDLGIVVTSMYGSTETGLVSLTVDKSPPFDSVGGLVSNVKVKVVDVNNGNELCSGENGEICIKSTSIMKKYFVEHENNSRKDTSGWFRTGDFGHFDEDGFIYIVDRIKDMIKVSGGYALFPAEIEAVVLQHPKVKEAAVVSAKHPTLLEVPKAFVVRSDFTLSKEDLLDFYNGKVAEHQRLEGGVVFIEEIPRVGIGKIDRKKLRGL